MNDNKTFAIADSMEDVVKVAVDAYHGTVEQYTVNQSMELLREALVEANGGSTKIDVRRIRDGKCSGLFALVEEILSRTAWEGVLEDEIFKTIVDFRNVALGDKNLFLVEDDNLFVVAEAADGTQGIRRQRLGGMRETDIPTSLKVVKIYEELSRLLADRADFNYFIDKVSKSFRKRLLDDMYALWNSVSAADLGGAVYFPTAGAYDEDELLELIAHVEAASDGKTATLLGTKKALRNLAPSVQGSDSRSDLYNMGYYGKFYGSPVIAIPQRHKFGSTDFVQRDDVITVIAGGDKPIKCVYEGDPLVIMGNPLSNGDLTQEFFYGERYGMGIVLAGGNAGIGRYQLA